jgi:hypothetical protein
MAATTARAESPVLDENIDSIPYHTTYAARNYIVSLSDSIRNLDNETDCLSLPLAPLVATKMA